ncbi:MAG: hypothetical protein BGO43_07105 [Gammaproteobacteria bacterium 39-13]|nr:hypothetical protein [Gammaproteobacteria bacterium]OJV88356.1 MAG: hypothetical protein BGO43_07105 [Gammaproteobacteria bacterium 39-13]
MLTIKITDARKKRDKQILQCIYRALAEKIAMTDKPIVVTTPTDSFKTDVHNSLLPKSKQSAVMNLYR